MYIKKPCSLEASCFEDPSGSREAVVCKEVEAKRWIVVLGFILFATIQLFFIIRNISQGRVLEPSLDSFSVLVFLFSLILIYHRKTPLLSLRIMIFTLILAFSWGFFFKEYESAALLWFFIFPAIVFFPLGFKEGTLWVVPIFTPVLLLCFFPSLFPIVPLDKSLILHYLASSSLFMLLSGILEWLRSRYWIDLNRLNSELCETTEQLKTLEGLIPICSYCKNIRDDKGYWSTLEKYIQDNSHAQISHDLCDTCVKLEKNHKIDEIKTDAEVSPLVIKDEHEKLRRRFISILGFVMATTISLFAIRDLIIGNVIKFIIQIVLSSTIAGLVIYSGNKKISRIISHLIAGSLFGVLILPYFGNQPEFSEILWFFLFPTAVNYLVGHKIGLLWISGLLLFLMVLFLELPFLDYISYPLSFKLFFLTVLFIVIVMSYNMERLRSNYTISIEKGNKQLEETLENIRTFKGLVPVCSSCKSIRNDKGFWTSIENYLSDNTELKLSHGICNSCMKKQFPEIYDSMESETEI
jgi:ABC-type multidrug transport system fused ATPase/permease subunit